MNELSNLSILKKLVPEPGNVSVGVLLGGNSMLGSRCWISVDDVQIGSLQGCFDKLASFE